MKKIIRITESQLKNLIEKTILKEETFKIEPKLVFKIFDILSDEVKGFSESFPIKTHFFHYLNDRL